MSRFFSTLARIALSVGVAGGSLLHAQQMSALPGLGSLVPASMQPMRDKAGNEWTLEQNGQTQRSSSGNQVLNSANTLIIGTDQFYCNQPMATQDGKEFVLFGQQPMSGLQIVRYIRLLDKEGGLRYVESLTNVMNADISTNVELRSNFGNPVKTIFTETGRNYTNALEKNETSVIVPGGNNQGGAVFTYCGPRSTVKPRIAVMQQYQTSAVYSVVIPAGKTVNIMHTVTQTKMGQAPSNDELTAAIRPIVLTRHLRDLPKGLAALLVNVRGAGSGPVDLAAWFPEDIFGIKRDGVDILALGEGTRLHGRATCARLVLHHRLGKYVVPWDKVVAIAGKRASIQGPQLYLNDGQALEGRLEAEELKFTLTSGLQMALKVEDLDRLVIASTGPRTDWPENVQALVEFANGERMTLRQGGNFDVTAVTPWGSRAVKLSDLTSLTSSVEEGTIPLLSLRDGSRLRAWLGTQGQVQLDTLTYGVQSFSSASLRAVVVNIPATPVAEDASAPVLGLGAVDEDTPTVSYADLAGDQRVIAQLSAPQIRVATAGGVLGLEPASIKEMRSLTEEMGDAAPSTELLDGGTWFHIELWGGGSVLGQLLDGTVRLRLQQTVGAPQEDWTVPAREIVRIVNPVPKIQEGVLARIGQLLRELGHDDWRTRERATAELKSLGEMARPSLQEAAKQSEDAEVKRRLESILGDIE